VLFKTQNLESNENICLIRTHQVNINNFHIVRNLNPETAAIKREHVFENPKEWTLTSFNKDGVKTFEYKFKIAGNHLADIRNELFDLC
jgi:hypothetical protein